MGYAAQCARLACTLQATKCWKFHMLSGKHIRLSQKLAEHLPHGMSENQCDATP